MRHSSLLSACPPLLLRASACAAAVRLLRFQVRCPDDRPPLLGLSLVVCGQRLRRLLLARPDLLPDVAKPLPDGRVRERADDRAVELVDDVLGRSLRRP